MAQCSTIDTSVAATPRVPRSVFARKFPRDTGTAGWQDGCDLIVSNLKRNVALPQKGGGKRGQAKKWPTTSQKKVTDGYQKVTETEKGDLHPFAYVPLSRHGNNDFKTNGLADLTYLTYFDSLSFTNKAPWTGHLTEVPSEKASRRKIFLGRHVCRTKLPPKNF